MTVYNNCQCGYDVALTEITPTPEGEIRSGVCPKCGVSVQKIIPEA